MHGGNGIREAIRHQWINVFIVRRKVIYLVFGLHKMQMITVFDKMIDSVSGE